MRGRSVLEPLRGERRRDPHPRRPAQRWPAQDPGCGLHQLASYTSHHPSAQLLPLLCKHVFFFLFHTQHVINLEGAILVSRGSLIESKDQNILLPDHIGLLGNKPQLPMLITLQAARLGEKKAYWHRWLLFMATERWLIPYLKAQLKQRACSQSLPKLLITFPLLSEFSVSQPDTFHIPLSIHLSSLCSLTPSPGLVPEPIPSLSLPLFFPSPPFSLSLSCAVLRSSCVPKGVQ